tara:strand:- start:4079 stop:4873 length:795 start_codon:yes stop_codon:yes gene_type:complete
MSFTGKTKASTYKDILQMNNSNSGVDATSRNVVDGEGTSSAIFLADDHFAIRPANLDSTATFVVKNKSGITLFSVDSTNSLVKAGATATSVNTQFKEFGLWNFTPTSGEHHPMTTAPMITSTSDADYTGEVNGAAWGGTGSNPSTSLTISSASLELVPSLFLLQQDIFIDEIQYIIASSAASTVGIKLMSYDIVTGSSSTAGDLTNGELISTLSAVTTGDAQVTNGTISPIKANNDSGKALVMFAEASDTDKFTIQATIKYHIT